jgi:hypothetical protein
MRKMMKFNKGVNMISRQRQNIPKVPLVEAKPEPVASRQTSKKKSITVKNIVLNSDPHDHTSSMTNIIDTAQKRTSIKLQEDQHPKLSNAG